MASIRSNATSLVSAATKVAPLYYETHMHTPLCHHAVGEPEEYAAEAARKGLKGVIVTCHNPLPDGMEAETRMRVGEFGEYLERVSRARAAMVGVADVRLGLECDYLPGLESWLEEQLSSAQFDYVLGSVHPHLKTFREVHWKGDQVAYQRVYFERLADAAETGLFDCISHPDLVKNVTASAWDLERIMDSVSSCLDRIAATGCALELNTSGLNKRVPEMNPGPGILRAAQLRGIPVVVGGDAHKPERVGDHFAEAFVELANAGYDSVSVFLKRERVDYVLDVVRNSFTTVDT